MRRRVLVEHSNFRAGLATAEAIHDAGFAVATCPGPRTDDPCPVLRGRKCSLAQRADVIVSNLAGHPQGTRVAVCLQARLPRTPLLLNVEPDQAASAVHAALAR